MLRPQTYLKRGELKISMSEVPTSNNGRKYIPYLEGIRGFGFLSVFFIHYFAPYQMAHKGTLAYRFWTAAETISFFAVPVFFVLSGYLIGGILVSTRNREGYFKIFYGRRLVRVFPVYYITLLFVAAFEACQNFHLDHHFWVHFLFIQNLFPSYVKQFSPAVLLHYWSLAVEEQFYLLWPLVVWFFPERRKLFAVAGFLVLVMFGVRLVSPHVFASPDQIRYFSPTRADAILFGVMLALVRDKAVFEKMKQYAKWVVLPGIAMVFGWTFWTQRLWPQSFRGEQIMIPWVNITAVALVMSVMEESSWFSRVCSKKWICWLGRRSYSLYIFHLVYIRWFYDAVIPYFDKYVPHLYAFLLSNALAFALTLLLATLSYHLIEKRTQKLKQYLKYGEVKTRSARPLGQAVVETGV